MKTLFTGFVCFCIVSAAVFGQAVDRTKYKAIDPFDYKLEEEKAAISSVRKYASVVQYQSQSGTVFSFISLDQGTSLELKLEKQINPPSAAQKVTIYFTATKGIIDSLVLDEIDFNNTTEAGIRVVKSTVPSSSGIKKTDYTAIDPFDYKSEAEFAQSGNVRRYASSVQFSGQSGLNFSFVDPASNTLLSMKVSRRFPPLAQDQKVTVYYTATKRIIDSLVLDDIEL